VSWRGGVRLARDMAEVMMRLISFAFEDLESSMLDIQVIVRLACYEVNGL
jgi:hypothetical protein